MYNLTLPFTFVFLYLQLTCSIIVYLRTSLCDTYVGGASADDGSGDWKKCQAVAGIISSCPSGVSAVEEYYSLICPQVK